MRLAALLVCLALPAAAQDLIYSDEASVTCVNSAPNGEARLACLGTSAQACMRATDAGGVTVGMVGCLDREYDLWDRVLNQNYQIAMQKAQAADAENRYGPRIAESLRDMQRAWIPYRDAKCAFLESHWGGGTGGGPALIGCLMRETGKQALFLYDAWIAQQ